MKKFKKKENCMKPIITISDIINLQIEYLNRIRKHYQPRGRGFSADQVLEKYGLDGKVAKALNDIPGELRADTLSNIDKRLEELKAVLETFK